MLWITVFYWNIPESMLAPENLLPCISHTYWLDFFWFPSILIQAASLKSVVTIHQSCWAFAVWWYLIAILVSPELPQIAETTTPTILTAQHSTNVAAGAFFTIWHCFGGDFGVGAYCWWHTLGGTIGDKAEVTNHECQQRWHELGSVVQRESVRTRRESTRLVRLGGGRGGAKTNLFNLGRAAEKSERGLKVIWLI